MGKGFTHDYDITFEQTISVKNTIDSNPITKTADRYFTRVVTLSSTYPLQDPFHSLDGHRLHDERVDESVCPFMVRGGGAMAGTRPAGSTVLTQVHAQHLTELKPPPSGKKI